MSDAQYTANVGKRATIQSRHRSAGNGRQCRIIAVERHGKGCVRYYRVNRIDRLHPASERLYKVGDLIVN